VDTEAYFGMILNILIGLTLIVLVMAFLYLIYGEREERTASSKVELFKNASKSILSRFLGFFVMF